MCRQAEVRRHDGLRAEGRSPYVGLRDSLRTAEKNVWGGKKNWRPNFFGGGRKRRRRGRIFLAAEFFSGGYAPDSAKAEGSSIVDEPGEG